MLHPTMLDSVGPTCWLRLKWPFTCTLTALYFIYCILFLYIVLYFEQKQ